MLEDVARGLWSIVRFVAVELFWSIVLFQVGRAFLLSVTLGRFPRSEEDLENFEEEITMAGLCAILLVVALIALLR